MSGPQSQADLIRLQNDARKQWRTYVDIMREILKVISAEMERDRTVKRELHHAARTYVEEKKRAAGVRRLSGGSKYYWGLRLDNTRLMLDKAEKDFGKVMIRGSSGTGRYNAEAVRQIMVQFAKAVEQWVDSLNYTRFGLILAQRVEEGEFPPAYVLRRPSR